MWQQGLQAQSPLAVVLVDIDAFKAYNDTLGHQAGDTCLIEIANAIRQAASRAGSFAARYGGEEFVVLIPDCAHPALLNYAEGMRQACQARAITHPASPVAAVVTVSIGVALCVPSAQSSAQALIGQADAALYRAKNEGRNCVR